jgi:hypothetical protein
VPWDFPAVQNRVVVGGLQTGAMCGWLAGVLSPVLEADRCLLVLCSVLKDKTIKLWKITERDKRPEGYNLKDEEGKLKDLSTVTSLQVSVQCGGHSQRRVSCDRRRSTCAFTQPEDFRAPAFGLRARVRVSSWLGCSLAGRLCFPAPGLSFLTSEMETWESCEREVWWS